MSEISDLERRVKNLEDRQRGPGLGCLTLVLLNFVFWVDWWFGSPVMREVIRPWMGQ